MGSRNPFSPEEQEILKKLIQITQHLKSGIPSASTCQVLLADRKMVVDYNLARRLVNGVLSWRKQRIKDGISEEKVGKAVVDTDLITARSKGKTVVRLMEGTEKKEKKVKKEETASQETAVAPPAPAPTPAPQQVIHSRPTARYGHW